MHLDWLNLAVIKTGLIWYKVVSCITKRTRQQQKRLILWEKNTAAALQALFFHFVAANMQSTLGSDQYMGYNHLRSDSTAQLYYKLFSLILNQYVTDTKDVTKSTFTPFNSTEKLIMS